VKDTAETKPKICHSDNPTGQNPDLKAKITSKIESKNVFAFLKLFRFRVNSETSSLSHLSLDKDKTSGTIAQHLAEPPPGIHAFCTKAMILVV
jgi:hypothetical protein